MRTGKAWITCSPPRARPSNTAMRKASSPPPKSDIVFNSPIVLYTHKAVADGLVNGGLVTKDNSGAYHMCLIWP